MAYFLLFVAFLSLVLSARVGAISFDKLIVLNSSDIIKSCAHNSLLDSSVAKFVDDCNVQVSAKSKQAEIGQYLLCVAYYDMNFRLCTSSRFYDKLNIPSDSATFDKLMSSMNGEDLRLTFCDKINHILNVTESSSLAGDYISLLRKEFLDEYICHKLCYNFDESSILPICKSILWGNLALSQVLKKQKDEVIDKEPNSVPSGNETNTTKQKVGEGNASLEPASKVPKADSDLRTTNAMLTVLHNGKADMTGIEKSPVVSAQTSQAVQLSPLPGDPNEAGKKSVEEQPAPNENVVSGNLDVPSPDDRLEQNPAPNKATTNERTNEQNINPDNSDDQEDNFDSEVGGDPNDESLQKQNQEESYEAYVPKLQGDKIGDGLKSEIEIPSVAGNTKQQIEEEKTDETQIKPDIPHAHNQIYYPSDVYASPRESHFYTFFFTIVALSVVVYVIHHNKNKILGLLIEGRHKGETRRSTSGPAYRRLDNLEQVVSSGVKTPPSNVIY